MAAGSYLLANFFHGGLEQGPILSLVDGFHIGPDHFHSIFIQDTRGGYCQCRVQSRLPTHGGQNSIGSFLLNYFFNHFWSDWLDISAVG